MKEVAALPAEQQVKAVAKKLQELKPGFDGKLGGYEGGNPTIEQGRVTRLGFMADKITDLSPVRALTQLREFRCFGSKTSVPGKLSDLSPLQGLPFTHLNVNATSVTDLSTLRSCPRLRYLHISYTPMSDLSPLHGMKLICLWFTRTKVSDLAPLQGMPLTAFDCTDTGVSDLTHLMGMNLVEVGFSSNSITKGLDGIRQMNSLKVMRSPKGKLPPAEFWKGYDAGEFGK